MEKLAGLKSGVRKSDGRRKNNAVHRIVESTSPLEHPVAPFLNVPYPAHRKNSTALWQEHKGMLFMAPCYIISINHMQEKS